MKPSRQGTALLCLKIWVPAGLQGVNKQREAARKVEYRTQLGHSQIYGVDVRAVGKGLEINLVRNRVAGIWCQSPTSHIQPSSG